MTLQHLPDSVRQRMDRAVAGEDDIWSADALELVDDLGDSHARAQSQGDHAADGFGLSLEKPAGFAELGENFKYAVLVLVDRDKQIAVRSPGAVSKPALDFRAFPGNGFVGRCRAVDDFGSQN